MTLERYIQLKGWYEFESNSLYFDRRECTMEQFCGSVVWNLEHKLGISKTYATDIVKNIAWGMKDAEGNGSYEKTLHYKFAPHDINFFANVKYGKEGDTRFIIIEKAEGGVDE